jgi:hypothetical protein
MFFATPCTGSGLPCYDEMFVHAHLVTVLLSNILVIDQSEFDVAAQFVVDYGFTLGPCGASDSRFRLRWVRNHSGGHSEQRLIHHQ